MLSAADLPTPGLRQGRALREPRSGSWRWMSATVTGLALPFLVTDLANLAGAARLYLAACAVGGVFLGAVTGPVLPRLPRSTGSVITQPLLPAE